MHWANSRCGEYALCKWSPGRRVGGVRNRRIVKPTHGSAVQLDLVDRLWRPDAAQFWRTIGRCDDHRNVRQPGFDNRRVEVHRSGATRAEQDCRYTVEPKPERDEGSNAFVMDDVQRQFSSRCQRQRHRGAARTGRDYGMTYAAPNPLVDKSRARGRVGSHGLRRYGT